MLNEENIFDYIEMHPESKVCIYGAGKKGEEKSNFFKKVDYFCDINADKIKQLNGIPCITPQQLNNLDGSIIVLVCIKQEQYRYEALSLLQGLDSNIVVFDLYNNKAFTCFDMNNYSYCLKENKKFRVNIVCSDEGWILKKFASKLKEEITNEGFKATISKCEDPSVEVNHYISFHILTEITNVKSTIRTTMITHVDTDAKRELVSFQARNGVMGICMSNDTMTKLASWGISRSKLCYINPAQDCDIKPRKIVLGITHRCYGKTDYRKRDDSIVYICEKLQPESFKIKIMGSGWDEIVNKLRNMQYEVEYYSDFDREVYKELIPSLDYWVYYGFDEGSMGFLDALAAGVKTIATPQGYHLDTKCGLTYPCSTIDDFTTVLLKIQKERESIVNSVTDWTWSNYAKKHIEIWKYMQACAPMYEILKHQGEYRDGIFSVLMEDNAV